MLFRSISTFQTRLDLSDNAIYDSITETLIIPVAYADYMGIFVLRNSAGLARISNIVNHPDNWDYRFYVEDPSTALFISNNGNLIGLNSSDYTIAPYMGFVQYRNDFLGISGMQYMTQAAIY